MWLGKRGSLAFKIGGDGSAYLPCCSMASQCSFSGFQENSVKPRMDESQEKGNKAKP